MDVLPQKFMIAIWLFLTTGVYSSEWFQIQRKNSDVFTIPPSQCKATNSDCSKYNALRGVTSCSCQCDVQNATFAFYENSWKCVGNDVVRRLLGCHKRTFFQNETPDQQLQVVNYVSSHPKYLASTLTGRCTVNEAASRTMRCPGNGLSQEGTIPNYAFEIVPDARSSTYKLMFDLPDENPLQGQIINLSIQCSGATADECLLFKMDGTTNCTAPLTTNVKTTISMIDGKSTEPSRLSSLSTSTEVTKVPGSESDRNSGAIISTSIVALIAGINGFLVRVILVIGLYIYHRQRKRSGSNPPTSVPSGTLESSLSSLETQNGQQNTDYATLTPSNCGSPIYNNGDDTVINFNSSGRCPRVDDAGYAKVGSPCRKGYPFLAPGPERTTSEYQRLVKPGEDDSGYLLPMEERAPRIPAATGGPSTTVSLINSEAQNPSAQDRPKDKEYDYAKPENLICLTVSRSSLENLDLDTDPSYVDKRVEDKETTDNGPSSPFYATVEEPSSPGSPSEEGPLGDTPEEAPVKKDPEDLIPEYLELLPDTGSESGTSLRAENSKA